ncbi:MAG: endonuclease VIII, partial [Patescibacteria group bacterium]
AFLATEQRIPGLGNGTLQDILFVSGINPQTKIKALSNEDLEKIYFIIKSTIKDISEKKGRDIEKDIYGNKGSYKTILSNKTYKQPCPKCKGDIIKKSYLGGTVYFCPNCQPVIS